MLCVVFYCLLTGPVVELLYWNYGTRHGRSLCPGVYGSIGSAALHWQKLFSSADIEVPSTCSRIKLGVMAQKKLIVGKSEALTALTWQDAASHVPQERRRNIQSAINGTHIVTISYNLFGMFYLWYIYIHCRRKMQLSSNSNQFVFIYFDTKQKT
jgi:hypothetical protein